MSDERAPSFRWWLRLQLGLALAGGAVWLLGVAIERDFFTGLGAGLLIAALILRFGRRAATRDEDAVSREDASAGRGDQA